MSVSWHCRIGGAGSRWWQMWNQRLKSKMLNRTFFLNYVWKNRLVDIQRYSIPDLWSSITKSVTTYWCVCWRFLRCMARLPQWDCLVMYVLYSFVLTEWIICLMVSYILELRYILIFSCVLWWCGNFLWLMFLHFSNCLPCIVGLGCCIHTRVHRC